MTPTQGKRKLKPRTWYKYAVITRNGDILHLASDPRTPHYDTTKISVRITELLPPRKPR